jgi:hypothetical protein
MKRRIQNPKPLNISEAAHDITKSLEYGGEYADKIVIGTGTFRHVCYYLIHAVGLVASLLLIYGNRKRLPRLYWPFFGIGVSFLSTCEFI